MASPGGKYQKTRKPLTGVSTSTAMSDDPTPGGRRGPDPLAAVQTIR